jgi:hypothetical protein
MITHREAGPGASWQSSRNQPLTRHHAANGTISGIAPGISDTLGSSWLRAITYTPTGAPTRQAP